MSRVLMVYILLITVSIYPTKIRAEELGATISVSGTLKLMQSKVSRQKFVGLKLDKSIHFTCDPKVLSGMDSTIMKKIHCGEKNEYDVEIMQVYDANDPCCTTIDIFENFHGKHVYVSGSAFHAYAPTIHQTEILMTVADIKESPLKNNSDKQSSISEIKSYIVSAEVDRNLENLSCDRYLTNMGQKSVNEEFKNLMMPLVNDKKNSFDVFYTPAAIACECKTRSPNSLLDAYKTVLENTKRNKLYNCPRGLGVLSSEEEKNWKKQFFDWVYSDGNVPPPTQDGLPACALKQNNK